MPEDSEDSDPLLEPRSPGDPRRDPPDAGLWLDEGGWFSEAPVEDSWDGPEAEGPEWEPRRLQLDWWGGAAKAASSAYGDASHQIDDGNDFLGEPVQSAVPPRPAPPAHGPPPELPPRLTPLSGLPNAAGPAAPGDRVGNSSAEPFSLPPPAGTRPPRDAREGWAPVSWQPADSAGAARAKASPDSIPDPFQPADARSGREASAAAVERAGRGDPPVLSGRPLPAAAAVAGPSQDLASGSVPFAPQRAAGPASGRRSAVWMPWSLALLATGATVWMATRQQQHAGLVEEARKQERELGVVAGQWRQAAQDAEAELERLHRREGALQAEIDAAEQGRLAAERIRDQARKEAEAAQDELLGAMGEMVRLQEQGRLSEAQMVRMEAREGGLEGAWAVVAWDAAAGQGRLLWSGAPRLRASQRYRLWAVDGVLRQRSDCGVLPRPEEGDPVVVPFRVAPEALGQVSRFVVTREPVAAIADGDALAVLESDSLVFRLPPAEDEDNEGTGVPAQGDAREGTEPGSAGNASAIPPEEEPPSGGDGSGSRGPALFRPLE